MEKLKGMGDVATVRPYRPGEVILSEKLRKKVKEGVSGISSFNAETGKIYSKGYVKKDGKKKRSH